MAFIMLAAASPTSAASVNMTDVNETTYQIFSDDDSDGNTDRSSEYHDLFVIWIERDVTFRNHGDFADQRDDNVQRRLIVTQYIEHHTAPEEVYNVLYTPPFSWSDNFDLDFEVPQTEEEFQDFNVVVNIESQNGEERLWYGGGIVATVYEDGGIIP